MKKAKIAVVGGGIAGCSAAYALKNKGFEVIVFEKEKSLAGGTSGHPLAIFKPRLQQNLDPYGAFYLKAYQFSLSLYDKLEDEFGGIWHPTRGVFQTASDKDNAKNLENLSNSFPDFLGHFRFDKERSGLNFINAGCLFPENLCSALTRGVEVVLGHKFQNEPGFEATVHANGHDAFNEMGEPPARLTRGQINFLPALDNLDLEETLSFPGGYLTPQTPEGFHVLGTSFQLIPNPGETDWQTLRQADFDKNLEALRRWSPKLAGLWKEPALLGRTGLRVETLDHLPVVGPLFSREKFIKVFREKQKLHHSQRTLKREADIPGLFVLGGLGGRGFMSGPLLGEILSCQIAGMPLPCPTQVIAALSPARFLQKALLAGKVRVT